MGLARLEQKKSASTDHRGGLCGYQHPGIFLQSGAKTPQKKQPCSLYPYRPYRGAGDAWNVSMCLCDLYNALWCDFPRWASSTDRKWAMRNPPPAGPSSGWWRNSRQGDKACLQTWTLSAGRVIEKRYLVWKNSERLATLQRPDVAVEIHSPRLMDGPGCLQPSDCLRGACATYRGHGMERNSYICGAKDLGLGILTRQETPPQLLISFFMCIEHLSR